MNGFLSSRWSSKSVETPVRANKGFTPYRTHIYTKKIIFLYIKKKAIPALHKGYLHKRGKVNRAFRERWCVLQEGKLLYYKNPEQSL